MRNVVLGFLSMLLYSAVLSADASTQAVEAQNKEVLKMAVSEISKKLPQKIDDYTALVDIKTTGQTLIYIYEINTGAKSDESVRREDKDRMSEAITRGSCTSSKRFLDSGIALTYIYNNANTKAELFEFHVTKQSCERL